MSDLAQIFMLTGGDTLAPMEEHEYDSEDLLQQLLAKYPELLAGDQIDPEEPRRWLFISREMSVPEEPGGMGRWSLDHLFVDQDGVPTLVECKRSSDTRTRREVVGQMLDYAANASEYWPIDRLRQSAGETAAKAGQDVDTRILAFLREEDLEVIETFWETIEQNLRAGRIRLLFVSDRIPRELRRIVEFLNIQMERTEVLAVEVKQFTGADSTVFAPRVLGLTEAARETKQTGRPPSRRRRLTEQEFFDVLAQNVTDEDVRLARRLKSEAENLGGEMDFGEANLVVTLPDPRRSGRVLTMLLVNKDGGVWGGWLANQLAELGLPRRIAEEYFDRVAALFDHCSVKRKPSGDLSWTRKISLSELSKSYEEFKKILAETIEEIKQASQARG